MDPTAFRVGMSQSGGKRSEGRRRYRRADKIYK